VKQLFLLLVCGLVLAGCVSGDSGTGDANANCTPGLLSREETELADRIRTTLTQTGVQATTVTVTRREETLDCATFRQRDTTVRVVVTGAAQIDPVIGALVQFPPDRISPPPITLIIEFPNRTVQGDYGDALDAYNNGERGQDLLDAIEG
jgi:hypothetical protein